MKNKTWRGKIKSLSENKKGICSIQVIIVILAVILFFNYILESTSIGIKSIAKRQDAVQEKLLGENLFKVVDLYVIEEFENIYNKAAYKIVENHLDNETVKLIILRYSCFEFWSKGVNEIGIELMNSKILKDLNLKYKEIDELLYIYDDSGEKGYYIISKYLNVEKIFSSEDFGITIKVTVYTENQILSYNKDYIFKIPFYKDEDIDNIRADKDNALNISTFKLDESNIITSEVYYENF